MWIWPLFKHIAFDISSCKMLKCKVNFKKAALKTYCEILTLKLWKMRFYCILGHFFQTKSNFSKCPVSLSLQLGFGRLYKIWPFFAKFWPFSGYFCCRLYKILVFLQNYGLFRAFSKKARISGRGQKFWPEWKHCIWLFLGDFIRKINNAFLAAGSPLGAYGRSILILKWY